MAISTQRLRRVSGDAAPKLLVVEDDIPLARALMRELERRGGKVTLAHSVKSALSTNEIFDCSILDIELPDGDGVSLGSELLNRARVRKVIFFSGTYDEEWRSRAESVGVFVQKGEGFSGVLQALYGKQTGPSHTILAVGSDEETERQPASSPAPPTRVKSSR